MKVLVIGGTGDVGKAIVHELKKTNANVLIASYSKGDIQVDITSTKSLKNMYEKAGTIDAVICTAGKDIPIKTVTEMSKEDYLKGMQQKLLGQIDLVLTGLKYMHPQGTFTLTSGILNEDFIPKGSCFAMINHAIEAFVRSAALELPEKMRLNIVSPNLLESSVKKYGKHFVGFEPVSSKKVAMAYLRSIFGIINGKVLKVW